MERERRGLQLLELPVEILVDILLRLPTKKVACVKCVSKTLSKMMIDVSFSALHARLWAAAVAPRLMYCSRSRNRLTLQSLKYKDKTLTKGRHAITVSSCTPGFVRFVFHNILCLGFSWTGCTLVNSLGERGVLQLPECSFARQEMHSLLNTNSWFAMGIDDKTNTYKILCVATHEKDDHTPMTTAHVLVLGTNSWRQISSLPPQEFSWMKMDAMPVCANGAAHWLTGTQRSDHIVSFDFRKEEFCCHPTPPKLQSSSERQWLYSNWNKSLCTLKGCLALVGTKSFWLFSSERKIYMEIWVLKDFDQQEKLWELYYNGILDYFPSLSPMPPGEWEHGIFFTIYYNSWKASVFFIDIKFGSVNRVPYPFTAPGSSTSNEEEDLYIGTYSYPETLISLKDYGDLEDAHHHMISS